MIINKITTGFVIQVFDTEKQVYISQNFIAAAEVNYENTQGETIPDIDMAEVNFGPLSGGEPYLPFDMAQPGMTPYRQGVIDVAGDVRFEIEGGANRNEAIQAVVEGFDDDLRELLPDGSRND